MIVAIVLKTKSNREIFIVIFLDQSNATLKMVSAAESYLPASGQGNHRCGVERGKWAKKTDQASGSRTPRMNLASGKAVSSSAGKDAIGKSTPDSYASRKVQSIA
jgi:hypothetical protein